MAQQLQLEACLILTASITHEPHNISVALSLLNITVWGYPILLLSVYCWQAYLVLYIDYGPIKT